MLPHVFDIKSWISGHAVEMHEHTLPKSFKFKLDEAGKAVMSYRNWSHEPWQGPMVILKVLKFFADIEPIYLSGASSPTPGLCNSDLGTSLYILYG